MVVLSGVAALTLAAGALGDARFVVGPPPTALPVQPESFVVTISDPAKIARARQILAENATSATFPQVHCFIAWGSDGVNRNVMGPGRPLWNWHVTAVNGFPDMTIEILDASPLWLNEQENFDSFVQTTGGQYSWWSGTIVSEIPIACNAADVAGPGGADGADGQNTVDDVVRYLAAFFGGETEIADLAGLGGSESPDGQLTVDDLVSFLGLFFAPCE